MWICSQGILKNYSLFMGVVWDLGEYNKEWSHKTDYISAGDDVNIKIEIKKKWKHHNCISQPNNFIFLSHFVYSQIIAASKMHKTNGEWIYRCEREQKRKQRENVLKWQ